MNKISRKIEIKGKILINFEKLTLKNFQMGYDSVGILTVPKNIKPEILEKINAELIAAELSYGQSYKRYHDVEKLEKVSKTFKNISFMEYMIGEEDTDVCCYMVMNGISHRFPLLVNLTVKFTNNCECRECDCVTKKCTTKQHKSYEDCDDCVNFVFDAQHEKKMAIINKHMNDHNMIIFGPSDENDESDD